MTELSLYKFQVEGVHFLIRARRVILADDMGLGKTAQAVRACEEINASSILVVCPNTLRTNWANEIEKWAPGRPVTIIYGHLNKRTQTVKEFRTGYFIVNIECVRRTRKPTPPGLIDMLLMVSWDILIVDEAHNIKNRNSQQTRGVMELADRVEYVFLLTGTPIMNRVDDLWSPLHALYPHKYRSFWSFVRHHTIVYRNRFGWVIDGRPTQPESLRKELAPMFLRREKEEVFPEMPRKFYQKVWLDLEGEQLRIYREIEQMTMAEIDENTTISVPNILAKLTRCRQVAISPWLIGGEPDGVKLDAMMDIILGTDRKMIIFSQFAEAIRLAAYRLTKEGVGHVTLTGETRDADRCGVVKQFNDPAGPRVLLATTQTGGVGINLTSASLVVFLDKHWTPAINEQAIDRTRPHMQTCPVHIIELLARGTVDEMIEGVVSDKVNIIEAVIKRKKEAEPCMFIK